MDVEFRPPAVGRTQVPIKITGPGTLELRDDGLYVVGAEVATRGRSLVFLLALLVFAGAMVGYAFVVAMVLTSTDGARRWLGGRRWTLLHRSGMYVLYAIFLLSYLGLAARGDVLGVVATAALLGALGLRAANRRRLQRAASRRRGS
ncbi:MAG: hypothetical protein KDK70_17420 [Myxococcales bacterium]|nr:hypothetical protein [Myxococcales bacterium]